MSCNEKHKGWVKAFGVIFAVFIAFGFFAIMIYISRTQSFEESDEENNTTFGKHLHIFRFDNYSYRSLKNSLCCKLSIFSG